eukprot:PhF_6_TR11038/c0_g1_i1/m.17904
MSTTATPISAASPSIATTTTSIGEERPSIESYTAWLHQHSGASDEAMVCAAAYLSRLIKRPDIRLALAHTPDAIFLYVLVCVVLGVKYHDDFVLTNMFYAKLGGVATKDLNTFELDVLRVLEYRLVVDNDEYQRVAKVVCRKA